MIRSSQASGEWVDVAVGSSFSVTAPPGSSDQPGRGIDSTAGVIQTPHVQLAYDYGLYSDPLDRVEGEVAVQDLEIHGKAARIVSARLPQGAPRGPYFIGVHFPNVGQSSLGAVKLTLSAYVDDEADFADVEKVYRSIRFAPGG